MNYIRCVWALNGRREGEEGKSQLASTLLVDDDEEEDDLETMIFVSGVYVPRTKLYDLGSHPQAQCPVQRCE